ncbi:cutinase family protein [Nocardia cyriacigeorgica]|uniref:cutinase family protein n=1 Tax=Nocardia cyriacigeorgica TaxID=135487 RepID=UPI0024560BB0|nr:cutinase family protein [Nocardia cyriacigeorgica]
MELVVARGTHEPGYLGAVVGDPLYAAVSETVTVSVGAYAVRYPADLLDPASVSTGTTDLVDHLIARSARCPGQRYIIAGYSQGALVVHGALGTGAMALMPGIRQLPPAIADELVATCCRSALEAASLARARRVLLADGVDHREVQRLIDTAQSTRAMVALAVLGPSGRIEDLGKHLAREGKWAVGALRDATAGAHVPIGRSMQELIADTEKLVEWLAR